MADNRIHPRFAVDFGSTFSGEQFAGQGTICNLSVGGCSIDSKITLTANSTLGLHIQLPDSRWPLQIDRAVVRWARGHSFGVEFVQVSQDNLHRLQRLMQDLDQGPLVVMQRTRV